MSVVGAKKSLKPDPLHATDSVLLRIATVAYDEQLAERVRPLMNRRRGASEKKMFGGIGFLLHGNICVCVWKEYLIARIGADTYAFALRQPFVKKFDITGRAMTGWVMVASEGVEDDVELEGWVERAVGFVRGLHRK
jgi:TfoX/Sxy family transcriptional regulator of competence genes